MPNATDNMPAVPQCRNGIPRSNGNSNIGVDNKLLQQWRMLRPSLHEDAHLEARGGSGAYSVLTGCPLRRRL